MGEADPTFVLLGVSVVALVIALGLVVVIARTLHVCSPNELLVISGRRYRHPDGTIVGYRVVRGGRAIVIPILETAARMDLRNLMVEVDVGGLRLREGGLAAIQGIAVVKLASEAPLLHNAVERFLGMSREQVKEVAAATLTGCLRSVAVRFDAVALRHDAGSVAEAVQSEAKDDFDRMGLVLDTFKVRQVQTESAGYR